MSVKRKVINLVQAGVRAAGYDIEPSYLRESLPLRDHLRELFEQLDINLVLDIGAHHGEYGGLLREHVGYRGEIVSFEPVASSYAQLRQRSQGDTAWRISQFALGDASGSRTINITSGDAMSSFLNPSAAHVARFGRARSLEHIRIERTETVSVERLDAIWGSLLGETARRNVYLKMDTQGYDLRVLAGAGEKLTSVAALQTEVSVMPIYDDMTDYLTALKELCDYGFALTGIFPVTRDSRLRVIEFDCVMMNAAASDVPKADSRFRTS